MVDRQRTGLVVIGLLVIAAAVLAACRSGSTRKEPSATERAAPAHRIRASAALEAARAQAGREWVLAFVSNTGVPSPVASHEFSSGDQALLQVDGTAGQWVVEFFKNAPVPVSESGRTGQSYPFRRFLVTATGARELPQLNLMVPRPLVALDASAVANIDKALRLAVDASRIQPDVVSVASDVRADLPATWVFRLYKGGDVAATVRTSLDGAQVLP